MDDVVRVVASDGTRLAIRHTSGTGTPVVGLHGFTGNSDTMLPLLSRVSEGRPAISIDCVGHGASDTPIDLEPYEMPSVVAQIESVLAQYIKGPVHLIGYSMGGRIALSMAAFGRVELASLTTLSATPGISNEASQLERRKVDYALADSVEAGGVEAFVTSWLDLPLFDRYVSALSPDGFAATTAQRCTNTTIGLANSLRGTGTGSMPHTWDALSSLPCPYLTLAGEHDEKYVAIAKRAAEAAPDGCIEVVPGAGHALHVENLEEVARIVASFLRGCGTIA